MKITIISCGPGALEYLTEAAHQAVAQAEILIGAKRLLAMFPQSNAQCHPVGANISAVLEVITQYVKYRKIAVLVTGDAGLHSLATLVIQAFGNEHCQIIPGVSSVQVAFARLGLEWINAHVISAHGVIPKMPIESLQYYERIAILGGGKTTLHWVSQAVTALGRTHKGFICQNLTLSNEVVVECTNDRLNNLQSGDLTIIILVKKEILENREYIIT